MRQHIDLAWLRRDRHLHWFESMLNGLKPALTRIRIHELNWLSETVNAQWMQDNSMLRSGVQSVPESARVLANAVVQLRRYDALLVSVSLDTLVWTRRCLAELPRTPVVPIIGVLDGLQSGAMIDLLELGMTDFVQPSVCREEFRARLITAVSRSPRYVPLREPVASTQLAPVDPRNHDRADPRLHNAWPNEKLTVSHLVWPTIAFQENKQRVIDLFERQYLRESLRRANGNITEAARLAKKDRRAFWELMRRHELTSNARA